MTKVRAIAIAHIAADEARGVVVCFCALSLVVATLWQPF